MPYFPKKLLDSLDTYLTRHKKRMRELEKRKKLELEQKKTKEAFAKLPVYEKLEKHMGERKKLIEKLRTEHPDWDFQKAKEEAVKMHGFAKPFDDLKAASVKNKGAEMKPKKAFYDTLRSDRKNRLAYILEPKEVTDSVNRKKLMKTIEDLKPKPANKIDVTVDSIEPKDQSFKNEPGQTLDVVEKGNRKMPFQSFPTYNALGKEAGK